ncbi:MAG: chromate efflux transporter [Anaerolineae bacterium]|jgi:chromate transporter|nr:chromate efflux transporter [Anaerolineae bacterium]
MVGEVARLFLRLGFTAFGGPAAHIAMFRDEVVTRKGWITDEQFLDLLGATNLIPGPNSTEMAIHIGYVRAGWRGLLAAGICFILPAALIVLILAMLYVEYGTTPAAGAILYGIKPVIIAVILQAIWGLLGKAVKNRALAGIGIAAFALYLIGVNEILLMFGFGALYMLYANRSRLGIGGAWIGLPLTSLMLQSAAIAPVPVSLGTLFFTFLKIGSVLYGSGYVLLAFLQTDFVDTLGWLTQQQLLDAVAIGQFTPGPVFTTATFIGYVIAGVPGAILATIGIFLPSFVFVLISSPLIPQMRKNSWLGMLLDGVNVAALGLMAAVTVQLAQAALIDPITIAIAILTAIALIRFKVNSTWLIVAGAFVGLLYLGLSQGF